jgi:Phosphorylase superfamily
VGLRQPPDTHEASVLLSVGLAGGLSGDASPGVVLVPSEVTYHERSLACDPAWSEALSAAAERLDLTVLRAPLLTSNEMVTGFDRRHWAERGFAGVDMETGLLARYASRVAAVRVVLDAPGRELSPRWRHPLLAMLDPMCWGEAFWLARHAPRYARRAAEVLASALAERNVDAEV